MTKTSHAELYIADDGNLVYVIDERDPLRFSENADSKYIADSVDHWAWHARVIAFDLAKGSATDWGDVTLLRTYRGESTDCLYPQVVDCSPEDVPLFLGSDSDDWGFTVERTGFWECLDGIDVPSEALASDDAFIRFVREEAVRSVCESWGLDPVPADALEPSAFESEQALYDAVEEAHEAE